MKIGITIATSKTQHFINQAYVDYIVNAHMEPVLISNVNNVEDMAKLCDGLLLPGGIDLEPTFYGENNVASQGASPKRDNFERRTMRAFMNENKKIFGICRGFQLMVREFFSQHGDKINNASYYQHINDHSLANSRDVARSTPTHDILINTKIMYDTKANMGASFVNSMHHQALVITGNKLNTVVDKDNSIHATATTVFGRPNKKTGAIVEAVDILFDGCKLRGVQWHPEELNDVALLQTFFSKNKKGLENAKI